MKYILLVAFCFISLSVYVKSQTVTESKDTILVILENSRLKVTEYLSTPGKDICGTGKHSHNPHLTILLTDALANLIKEDGKSELFDLKAGTTFWSEAETHTVINNGNKPAKVYLIETK